MIRAIDRYGELVVYIGGLLFVMINAFFLYREFYYFMLLPAGLAIFYLAFFALDKLFLAVVFFTPLSIGLARFAGNLPFDVSLPTEPVIIVILGIAVFRMVYTGSVHKELILHPVSLSIMFYLAWIFITSVTSTMPLVSFKFLLVRLWFILVFYFFAVRIFARRRNIEYFLWSYIIALAIVVVYTLYNHAGYGLIAQKAAHWVVRPFYNDHTEYGAALALFLPVLAFFSFRRKKRSRNVGAGSGKPVSLLQKIAPLLQTRWIALFLFILFIGALVFSYSRAAWLSLFAASGVYLLVRLKIGFTAILSFTLAGALLIFMLRGEIVREMEKNTQDSSADFREHIRSMTNITSDASNLERINRWKAAIGMFKEKPVFGWGPGTYMFQYAPFQFSYDRTIISTNLADGGDAHSEYLGPLSETGLPGMLSFLMVAILALITGFRLSGQLARRKDRLLVLGLLLGLITYLVHGTLNNFLHSDKAAVPFWGFIAIMVAMDLYGKKTLNEAQKTRT